MKRLISLMLLLCLLLTGCSSLGERVKEPVKFYYIRQDYLEDMESVISSEVREASGHRYDLPYLLALYSMGPSSSKLVSPFPRNTKILPVEHSEEGLVLSIMDEIHTMTDAEYTVASACLAMTCFEIIDAEQIIVVCGDRSVAIRKDNLLMHSSSEAMKPEESK